MRAALILLIIAGLALHGALGPVSWVIGGAVAITYWVWDVRRHPRVQCRMCSGSGDHHSKLGGGQFRRPFGDCWYCGGRKAFPRFGLRFVDRKRYDEIRSKISSGREKI